MKRCAKTMIDKTNKLWKWSKPTKRFREQYMKMTGLIAKETGMMTDKGWELYMSLFDLPKRKDHRK